MTKLTLDEFQALDLTLEPGADTFSVQNARFFAAASASAYKIGEGSGDFWAKKIFRECAPKFTRADAFPENKMDTEGFVMECRDALVVSFCGTNSVRDWFQNLDTELVLKHGYYVHEGFWEALNIVWVGKAKLFERVKAASGRKPIWFCGHSLGGALAIVAAFRCIRRGIPVQGVYTFGQPLVGELELAEALGDLTGRVHRFVNPGDPVPLIPLKGQRQLPKREWKRVRRGAGGKTWRTITTKPTKFAHVGEVYWFDDDGNLVTSSEPPKISQRKIKSLLGVASSLARGVLDTEQHDMGLYLRQLGDL